MRFLHTLLAALLAFPACKGLEDMPSDEACKQTGYAVASRTVTCLKDPDLANARYDRFEAAHQCVADSDEADFQCVAAVNATSCDEVAAFGEDWDQWLLRSSYCAAVFVHADGSPIPVPLTGSEVVADNPVCKAAMQAGQVRRYACPSIESKPDPEAFAAVGQKFLCMARYPEGAPAS